MALKKETIDAIASHLKIKSADLETAIKAEAEVDLTLTAELTVLTKEELETRDTNQKNEGIKAGKEIGVKEVRTAAGLEEGLGKDPKKIADAIIEKAVKDAKIVPDEKVKQLTDQVGLLQKQLTDKDVEITAEKDRANGIQIDRQILASMPKNRAEHLTDDEYLTLVKPFVKTVDGKLIIEKDGQPLRDAKTQNVLDLSAGLTSVFTERKGWLKEQQVTPPGRGGQDGKQGTFYASMSELQKDWEAQGKSINGAEFSAELSRVMKENPEFKTTD